MRLFPSKLKAVPSDAGEEDEASSRPSKDRIEALFREQNEALVRFLRSRLQSEAEAREAAQEAYVRLLQLDGRAQPSFLRAYLYKVATNVATDMLRQRATRLRNAYEVEEPAAQASPQEQSFSARQQLALVASALQELPPRCREAFRLSRDDERGTAEIARILGVSDRMVRLYLDRALEHIQSRLEASQGDAR